MDYYVKGVGAQPREGVTSYTLTCPDSAPSGGPYEADNWAKATPGEIRFDADQSVTIDPSAGSEAIAAKFNPVGGDGACATADGADQAGSASYRLDPAPAGGYTMLGAATVIADFTLPGDTSQVAARLLDVGARRPGDAGLPRALAPGDRRPDEAGVPAAPERLDRSPRATCRSSSCCPKDTNPGLTGGYGRASNDQQPVTVANLELRLPVVERPGSHHGLVKAPAERVLPEGYELAADFAALGNPHPQLAKTKLKRKGSKLFANRLLPGRVRGLQRRQAQADDEEAEARGG